MPAIAVILRRQSSIICLRFLFVTFQKTFDLSLEKIGLLISVNFIIQIFVDSLAARYIDRIGYRKGIVSAHALAAAGLLLMGTLPYVLPDPFWGLLTAICVNAIGGGLIEVLGSVRSLTGFRATKNPPP